MEIHGFVGFLASAVFHESRAAAFDLDSTSGLLLDVFDICSALANDLRAKIETGNVLHVDWDSFFRPFSLQLG